MTRFVHEERPTVYLGSVLQRSGDVILERCGNDTVQTSWDVRSGPTQRNRARTVHTIWILVDVSIMRATQS